MTREQLEHAIRAACDVAQDDAIIVFGSQAILGPYPDAPLELRYSIEVDMMPAKRADRVDAIDGALGELSQFQRTHGFYVHGLSIEAAVLPDQPGIDLNRSHQGDHPARVQRAAGRGGRLKSLLAC